LTLFLRIHRDEAGKLVGAFRDQGQNSVGGAMQFQVTPRRNDVDFTTPAQSPSGPAFKATLTPRKTLRLFWPDLGRDIELTRLAPADAGAYYPRSPAGLPYVYRAPQETGDGWLAARAGDVGFDEVAITRIVQQIASSDPSDRRPSLIHSLLVAYRGRLVVEEYFFGFDRDRPHDLRSAGKTFASVMLGAAMMRGVKIAPETPVYDLFGGVKAYANPEPRKSRVTLASLMTHTSGLACDDNNEASPGNEETMQNQRQQPDWWRYTLDLPLLHEPGQRYAYCSANTNLVGGALTKATDTWLPELFDRTVARPLQFGNYHWNLMPNDQGYLGGGSWLRPRDLLKVGQVYLDGGTWRGQRIVTADWVRQSTAPRIHISPVTTGLDEEQFGDSYIEADDAYAWHLGGIRSGDRTYRDYAASGNGGQLLLVIPEIEMVVVFTGGNYRQGGIWLRWPDEIVGKHLIPALRR